MSRHLPAVALALLTLTVPTAGRAQVAFFPVVTPFPNGVALSATPVVSHDRRYVRLTLDPQFNALQGFDGFSVPAAVSGGGLGAGGPGGLGGAGGGGGGRFLAGMDGPIGPPVATAALAGYAPAFPSTAAAAVLSGQAGLGRRPRLSDMMPTGDDPPPPRTRTRKSARHGRR